MGTPMLRAYMHGFFVDNRLYEKAKILTDPFAYETYRAQRIQKKIDEERKSRISIVRKLPKVCILDAYLSAFMQGHKKSARCYAGYKSPFARAGQLTHVEIIHCQLSFA